MNQIHTPFLFSTRAGGLPRTPIRQKMKTMPRSLQMLNAAMLNVKAQKQQPEGGRPANQKPRQRPPSRRLDGKGEENGRKRESKMGACRSALLCIPSGGQSKIPAFSEQRIGVKTGCPSAGLRENCKHSRTEFPNPWSLAHWEPGRR